MRENQRMPTSGTPQPPTALDAQTPKTSQTLTEAETKSINTESESNAQVFCVQGAEPEVQAYAMAKYSRSSLSMRESLAELNEQKAEKFLNTFYFQYGHRSIADLAHIAMAIERLSLLAATFVVDEQRWDGQERSTRYQDFKRSGYFVPPVADGKLRDLFVETIEFLFAEYRELSEEMFRYLCGQVPCPGDMKPDAYERTVRARAFDISRYLLPLATNTSLGQIVNARTLETQVSRLLSDPRSEVRQLAAKMKDAARGAAYNVNHEAYRKLVEAIRTKDETLADLAQQQLLKDVKVSPTLVKYAEVNQYEVQTRKELRQAARELMSETIIAPPRQEVDLLEDDPLEIELATTLLYEHSHYSYRQLRDAVSGVSESRRNEIIDLGMRYRGRHDELLRAFHAGQRFRFDILMDIGGFRDMHRHRRCTQILQDYTFAHGFDTPKEIADAGLSERFAAVMERARTAGEQIATGLSGNGEPESAQYLIPLAYRKRALFKMDLAEVLYISELRTTPAGHWSYRKVSYEMYERVAERHPSLAKYFRVTDIHEPVDLLKR